MKKKRIERKLADDVRKLQQFGLKITNPVPTVLLRCPYVTRPE